MILSIQMNAKSRNFVQHFLWCHYRVYQLDIILDRYQLITKTVYYIATCQPISNASREMSKMCLRSFRNSVSIHLSTTEHWPIDFYTLKCPAEYICMLVTILERFLVFLEYISSCDILLKMCSFLLKLFERSLALDWSMWGQKKFL